ncbi:MAG: peptidylprolyl isomerase [Blastocatellia bacterium]|nr:peptidylprolyl isomerase [Blastocatellia bacterium]
MSTAKNGDTVRVHYTGSFDDGTIFDSSVGSTPLEFTVGSGQVIPGFDVMVTGMSKGDRKTQRIPASEAYGERMDGLVFTVSRSQMPDHLVPEVGQMLSISHPSGETIPVTITGVSETELTLDANHELAGRDLTFEIELVEIA